MLKKPVFEEGNANWVSEQPSVIRKHNNTVLHSNKMIPVQASRKVNEKEVYSNLQKNRRVTQQPKFIPGQLNRTAVIKKVISKGDSTSLSYKLYTMTEVINTLIPSYRIEYLPEKHNQNLLRATELTLEENIQVMKELIKIQKNNK